LAPGATIGYFAQDLPLEREDHRVLDEIMALDMFNEGEARNLLGMFLFSGDDVFKKVSMLSGGERNRLALAKLVTRRPICWFWMSRPIIWTLNPGKCWKQPWRTIPAH
jgi:ATPase subunit of ABC transporter with duplicated ATPase domains